MVLDIDNFKSVNDTLGHAIGDTVLVDVCAKLKKTFFDNTIGRVGGDEFIVFTMRLENKEAILKKAEQICTLFRTTYIGPKQDYKISCSIVLLFQQVKIILQNCLKKRILHFIKQSQIVRTVVAYIRIKIEIL